MEGTGKSESAVNESGVLEDANINVFNNFNFGIIERPEQKVEVEKIITKMKLVNTQQNNVFEGNPAQAEMQGVSDLAKTSTEGSSYVKAELNEDAIYGSTLTLTYNIKVINTSDVNYYNDDYYFYGKADANKEVTMTTDVVYDYMDKTLNYIDSDYTVVDKTVEHDAKAYDNGGKQIPQNVLEITGFNDRLYTTLNKVRTRTNVKTSESIEISAQRILSSEDDDLTVVNEAQAKARVTSEKEEEDKLLLTRVKVDVPESEPDSAIVTVTPPTGEDHVSPVVYAAAGAIALAVLSAGIVVIKKKVV